MKEKYFGFVVFLKVVVVVVMGWGSKEEVWVKRIGGVHQLGIPMRFSF